MTTDEQKSGWRPIETAPDSKPVLIVGGVLLSRDETTNIIVDSPRWLRVPLVASRYVYSIRDYGADFYSEDGLTTSRDLWELPYTKSVAIFRPTGWVPLPNPGNGRYPRGAGVGLP